MLNDKICKDFNFEKCYKKWAKSTCVNLLSTIPRSWGLDNRIKSKPTQIIRHVFQSNTILNDEIERKKVNKKEKQQVN